MQKAVVEVFIGEELTLDKTAIE